MAQQSIEDQRSKVGVVFWVSAAVSLAFILWGVISPTSFGIVTQAVFDWVVSNLGWFYLLAGNFFLIFVFLLALSRYGKFRLGQEGERPQFSTFAWFAMMFQAGMGPSLIFWGVAEPLSHYGAPPFGMAQPSTTEAAQLGIQYTYFHWALHPWAMYAVVGLTVGYFSFRRNEPGLISPVFRPLLGDRVDGPLGEDHRRAGRPRGPVRRRRLSGHGRPPAHRWPRRDLRHPDRDRRAATRHRRHHGRLHDLGLDGHRQGDQLPQPDQHVRGRRLARLLPRHGPYGHPARRPDAGGRRLFWRHHPHEPEARLLRPRQRLARGAGPSSTGRGGSPGVPTSACLSPASRADAPSGSSSSGPSSARAWSRSCGWPCSAGRPSTSPRRRARG